MNRSRAGSVLILLGIVVSRSASSQSPSNSPRDLLIAGVVVDSLGAAIPFAYVFDNKSGTKVVAQRDGSFHLAVQSALPVTLGARHIGYRPAEVVVNAPPDALVRIRMDRLPQILDPVRIDQKAGGYDEYLDRQGYYRRSANAFGSTFITAADIDRRNPGGISSLMRDVPGVRVMSGRGKAGRNTAVLGRGGLCALGLVVDGQRVEIDAPSNEQLQPRIQAMIGSRPVSALQASPPGSGTLDEIVSPSMVAAIEIYPSAVSVPSELQQHVRACGLIVVWTRYQ